jgi:DNA-binding NarL/FixJ family response regulator
VTERPSHVVVVDDDPAFRKRLLAVLVRAGYVSIGVVSAEDALAAIDKQRPDVVLTEVSLPGMSGYDLCRQLKDQYGEGVAVMIVSGQRTEPFDRAAGILLGADDYMIKPIDPGELVARVWRLVGRSNMNHVQINGGGRLDLLSPRERQVLDLLAEGSNQEDIAEALFISPKTVATHIQRVLTKLDVRSRTQAVAFALRRTDDFTTYGMATQIPPTASEV